MRHLLRDSFIYLVTTLGIAWWYRKRMERHGPLVRVLCFHDVPDRVWFSDLLDAITKHHSVVSPEQFHHRDFCAGNSYVLLSFDDGYQSWIDVVLPELAVRDLKGLFLVNSGLLDVADKKEAQADYVRERLKLSPKHTLTWTGLHTLATAGHTIGGHSVGHYDLTTCTPEELVTEVAEDKAAIERHLNTTIKDFAYPFGTTNYFNSATNQVVTEAGYSTIYTAETGYVRETNIIPRTLIEKDQSIGSLRRWLAGGYDIFRGLYGIIS